MFQQRSNTDVPTMIYVIPVLLTLLPAVTSDTTYGLPIGSPILAIYPCRDSTEIIIWFEPGLPLKERNQYYLYLNRFLPLNNKIRTVFNSDVNITFNLLTDHNTYSRYTVRNGVRETRTFPMQNPLGHVGYGFKVKGTQPGVIPYLTSFIVNDVELCHQPILGFLDAYTADNFDTNTLTCGRRKIQHTELIVNSASTKPGDWPWHAAIYRLDAAAIKYICGGTLISKNAVLTAAHCASLRGYRLSPELLSVVLGKYNLIGGDIGSAEREVYRIILHEQFGYRHLNNDIALLKLKTEVIYTDYIQPACLWYKEADQQLPANEILGTVVGWGFDNTETLSRTMRQASMPMVAEDVCIRSNPQFYSSILNNKKFCAGYRNGTSACNGDSGSAFQVFIPDRVQNGNSGVWLVRGIVSLTVARLDVPICDPAEYVVFTDVDKYRDWIENNLNE